MSNPQIKAKTVNIKGGNFLNVESLHITGRATDALKRVEEHSALDAIHSSRAVCSQDMCTPGTRNPTQKTLRSLVSSIDDGDPDVIWMYGAAGAGKSAIMRTISNTLEAEGLLLGTFFFFRSDPTRNSSIPFVPTLAVQSAMALPQTQQPMADTVVRLRTLFNQSVQRQTRALLETPLLQAIASDSPEWTGDKPMVIIVDGLDECSESDRQIEIIQSLVQLTSAIRSTTNRRLKVIVASRPELVIKKEFERLYSEEVVEVVQLDESDAEIDLYYKVQFNQIRTRYNLPRTWPPLQQLDCLKRKTSGQYAFAKVSTTFIKGGDPVARLAMILKQVPIPDGLKPFEAMDALYATILSDIPLEMRDTALLVTGITCCESWGVTAYPAALDLFFQLDRGYTESRLIPHLASLMEYYEDGQPMRPYHTTLGDFLFDESRSGKFFLGGSTLRKKTIRLVLPCLVSVIERLQEKKLDLDDLDRLSWFLYESPFTADNIDLNIREWYSSNRDSYNDIGQFIEEANSLLWKFSSNVWAFACLRMILVCLRGCLKRVMPQPPPMLSGCLDNIKTLADERPAVYSALVAGCDGQAILGLFYLGVANVDGHPESAVFAKRVLDGNGNLAAFDKSSGMNFGASMFPKCDSPDNQLEDVDMVDAGGELEEVDEGGGSDEAEEEEESTIVFQFSLIRDGFFRGRTEWRSRCAHKALAVILANPTDCLRTFGVGPPPCPAHDTPTNSGTFQPDCPTCSDTLRRLQISVVRGWCTNEVEDEWEEDPYICSNAQALDHAKAAIVVYEFVRQMPSLWQDTDVLIQPIERNTYNALVFLMGPEAREAFKGTPLQPEYQFYVAKLQAALPILQNNIAAGPDDEVDPAFLVPLNLNI